MRKHYGSDADEAEVNLTPMLDIVFIMLIFFIVTASFVKEKGLDVTKPDAPDTPQAEKQIENLLIVIDSTDQLLANGKRIDKRQVESNIAAHIARVPEASVVVQVIGRASTEMAVWVLDAAYRVGTKPTIVSGG